MKISQNIFKLQLQKAIFNVQSVLTPDVDKPELQFLCSAWFHMVVYICVKFNKISQTAFLVTELSHKL